MSVPHYDDLLGDLPDSDTATKNGSSLQDFYGGSGSHLLDFSDDTQASNRLSSNGLDLDFDAPALSHHADMSSNQKSSEHLLDFDAESPAHPEYESSVYDFPPSNKPVSGSDNDRVANSHPEYDYQGNGVAEEEDLLSGAPEQRYDQVDDQQPAQYNDNDLLGDFEVLQKEELLEQPDSRSYTGEELQEQEAGRYSYGEEDLPVERTLEEEYPAEEEEAAQPEQASEFSDRIEPSGQEEDGYAGEDIIGEQAVQLESAGDGLPEEDQFADVATAEAQEDQELLGEEDTAELQEAGDRREPEEVPDVVEPEPAGREDSEPALQGNYEPTVQEDYEPTVQETYEPTVQDEPENVVVNQAEPPVEEEPERVLEEDPEPATPQGAESALESRAPVLQEPESEDLVADSFEHDRREKDLEHYCMDREESDLMEELEPHQDHLKAREERSRSPSRSIGPDISDEEGGRRAPSQTPETDASWEQGDTLRPREDRSHAPSRSPDPRDVVQESEAVNPASIGARDSSSDQGYREAAQTTQDDLNRVVPSSSPDTNAQSEGGEDEEEEEGIYENQPAAPREDIARETDGDRLVGLPASGTAHSLREKFLQAQQDAVAPTRSTREVTPPISGVGGEYVSEPRGSIEKFEGKPESGIFESQPVARQDVITSSTQLEDAKPEAGTAKSTAAKFKELQNQSFTPSAKKELTPDRSGRVEFVSEPKDQFEQYAGKSESGVFESEPLVNPDVIRSGEEIKEELPERGTAKNLAEKYKQIISDVSSPSASSRAKRDITPDRTGQVEYVSEPRGQHIEDYGTRVDAGIFENQPQRNEDVVSSDSVAEEAVPERGYAKNVAAKFKELETTAKSPPSTSPGRRKEFTPPREDERFNQAGIIENTPDFKADVIHAGDQVQEALPERGTAKNIAQRFRQLETDNKSPGSYKNKKEFTPPPGDAGIFENQPKQFQADYNRPAESGIIENQPIKRDDVIRGDEPPKYEEELPERGAARNLVSKWKQLESEGNQAKSPGSTGRPKEFTPPREEPRIAEQRKSPRTPLSPNGNNCHLDSGSVHPSDLPGQYQPQNEPSVFESSPTQRTDVLREADTDWAKGLPKKDTAKKMLAKFQNLQAESQKTPSGAASRKVGRSKSMRATVRAEQCGACEKTVYAMERLEMNKRVYHKACFRCTHCKAILTPKTFAVNNEVIFCTTHYKQLFATKGNYDEGFGRMQHKKRWNSNPDLSKDADES